MNPIVDSLSAEQERLCDEEQASPGSPARIRLSAILLNGPLHEGVLRRSINEIIRRHSLLRTVLSDQGGKLRAASAPSIYVELSCEDWTATPPADRADVLAQQIQVASEHPFGPAAPLLRAKLLRFGYDVHVLLLAAHAAIFDEESTEVFARELAELYGASLDGEPVPPMVSSSREFEASRWRRQWLNGVEQGSALSFWKEQLAGDLPVLQLPVNKPRPLARPFPSASVSRVFSPACAAAVEGLTGTEGLELRHVLLAAYFALLHRYTGQEQILVGSRGVGRDPADANRTIGCYNYPIVFKASVSPEESFRSLLQHVARSALAAQARGYVSLSALVEELRPAADASRHPLFQATLDVRERTTPLTAGGLSITPVEIERPDAEVDIALFVRRRADGLRGTLWYSPELFDASTMERMLGHFERLLEGAATRPDEPVSTLPLLTEPEKRIALLEWSGVPGDYPKDTALHRLFEAQVERAPAAVALTFSASGAALTYEELNRKANQLAHHLRSLGVGPGTIVAICIERSLEMIIGLLGILKAGGAFLPVDPTYPKDRVAFMLEDARAPLLITQEKLVGDLSAYAPHLLCLDADWSTIAREALENPSGGAGPDDLAYVIYTSGSTGRPKGVLLEHRGVCNLADVQRRAFGVEPGRRVLQFAAFSFDASVWELVMALTAGGTLCIAPAQALLPGPYLTEFLRAQSIDTLTIPPSALAALTPDECPGLRTIIVAGEACPAELVNRWAPGRRFWNAYGPTEATVCATMEECRAQSGKPSIGRPLGNAQVYVLDRAQNPVPAGVPGELYIGGVGLARGYHNRSELTADRFIKSPFSDDPSARLYKTGDLVKWLPDGRLDYLGRIDQQVKVRGFRIELEEIEAVLGQHPGVREAAAAVREDVPGDKRLVAYILPRSQPAPLASELRAFLQKKLPSFMVPSIFVPIERMPVSPSGKLDRRSLPAPPRQRAEPETRVIRPPAMISDAGLLQPVPSQRVYGGMPSSSEPRIEAALAQHHAVRKAVVMTREDSAGGRRIVAYCFKRASHSPKPEELAAFLRKKLAPELVPAEFVNVALEQERMCALHEAAPRDRACMQVTVARIDGPLDVKVFRRSVDEVVRRTAVLRTTFPIVDGRSTRSVERAMVIDVSVVDFALLPEPEWEGEIQRQIEDELNRPFDLVSGPLVRMSLLRFGRGSHVLIVAAHAAVFDDRSGDLLLQALFRSYKTITSAPVGATEPPPASMDYTRMQRQWLRSSKLEGHVSYWKECLSGPLPELDWPSEHKDSASEHYVTADREARPDPETVASEMPFAAVEALEGLARQENVSPFVVCLAAWSALIHRYTDQDDLLIATPVTGRTESGQGDVMGRFSYPAVMRVRLDGEPTFRELVRRVAEVVSSALPHMGVPFATVLEILGIPPERARGALLRVMLDFRREPLAAFSNDAISVVRMEPDLPIPDADLALRVRPSRESGLRAMLSFSPRLLNERVAEALLEHLFVLLEGAAATPDARVGQLPLLTEAERRRLLVEWNNTRTDYPRESCIHELFEAHAGRNPDAVAASQDGRELSYGDLNRRANRLARELLARGVRLDEVVGIVAERSLETLVGLLAILKAGGAYLPLDPTHPAERLELMLQDAGARVLLYGACVPEGLSFRGDTIPLAGIADFGGDDENFASDAHADSLAYVMFTSGSTGRPKGVAVPHRAVVRLVVATDYVSFAPSDRVMHGSNLSFDAATFEIWGALLNGGRLIVVAQDTLLAPEALRAKVRDEGISVMFLTTALFHHVASMKPEVFRGLRYVVAGGDKLEPKWARKAIENGRTRGLVNGYGPTENTTFSTAYAVQDVPEDLAAIPIGFPIANSTAYILNQYLEPVPVGARGELYVGGDGLARGYVNRPELTAERFIRSPFSSDPGARLYKTGDRARFLPDGTIAFMGRIDQQVKIRGFRIEPGEIEAVLASHPEVRHAAVKVFEDASKEKYLVAYASPLGSERLSLADLKRFLEEKLPSFMVPPSIVVMSELPLTPNGKVDRAALPSPQHAGSASAGESFVAPRTPIEESLAAVWSEVLGRERVSITDDFLALGGHSLSMMRILSRIHEIYGVSVPVHWSFRAPTVEKLARFIEGMQPGSGGLRASSIPKVDRSKRLPLSFSQQQIWLLVTAEPNIPFYNEPVTVTFRGALDVEAMEKSVNEIVRRHEAMRTTFAVDKGSPRQVITPFTPFTLPTVNLSSLPEGEREAEALQLATKEAKEPFDLAQGPFFRVTLVHLGPEEHKLFFTIHHIITDGVSLHNVLLGELAALYKAYSRGRPSLLPELPIHFADYALWQRKTQTVDALEEHISYWDRKLADAPALELPTDRPRTSKQSHRGAKHYFRMEGQVLQAFKALGKAEGATLFMVLLAAFKAMLHRYTGQSDLVIGTAVSGRSLSELEPLLGFFVNSVVLRTNLSGNPTFRELVGLVRDVTVEAYEHQSVPFEMLVEELRVTRTTSHNPIFQVAFVSEPPVPDVGPEWSISQHDVDTGTTKIDLTFHVDERPDHAILRIEHDLDLFERATIARMARHFESVLGAVAANPRQRLSEIPLMPEDERQTLTAWGGHYEPFVADACLHELFEAQAAQRPNATAVLNGMKRLTYRDLDVRANQLGNYLRKQGVGPESLVGLCVDRSFETVIAILGILKAGGAYVPLDPKEPTARLAVKLQDARPPIILTMRDHVGILRSGDAKVICLDTDWEAIASEPATRPAVEVRPDSLAYVMYGMGSDVRPKGVMIAHQNVISIFRSTRSIFEFSERDVWTMFHAASVDFSVWEMWGALLHGGVLVLVSYEHSKSFEAFYELLTTFRVTVLSQTPSAFKHLMHVEESPEVSPSKLKVRLVCLSGEVLDSRFLKPWFERHGDETPRVYNLYGLTGVTGFAAARRVRAEDLAGVASVIGGPIPGAELFILDPFRQMTPIGVFGEIYIGGPGLARGYFNNPELTAERLVRHPFKDEPDAYLYRTGDKARYLANGDIEFAGRFDQQVKIRGFPIQPREIEVALVEHPLIREASVIVREDNPGDQRLVAYYVKRTEQKLTTNELRSFLKERLPDYMVPTIFIPVAVISFVSNGRVDRRTLPAPDRNRPSLAPKYRLPGTAVEVLLRNIWTRLLQVDEIGVKDDFFTLGGHSLLAAQMIARARETFKVNIRHSSHLMRAFLENPTVAGFAEAIEMVREATPSMRGRRVEPINWNAEASLDSSLSFDVPPAERWANPAAILLTGATGFLGSFLLYELLHRTGADIHCLVRAPDVDSAMQRIKAGLAQMGLWDESFRSRIIPIPGDLSQLLLGLSPERFDELAKTIDVIHHNGAQVNFIYPYTALRPANVSGTREIIRLATTDRLKPVHYVSTLAILASYGFFGVRKAGEDIPLDYADHLFMGYPETKWVSEKMLLNAAQRGLPVTIYRPHDVSGHSKTGVWKTDGFLCSFLKAIVELGAAPDINLPLDLAPVDFVTEAVVHISTHEKPSGKVYHLSNPNYKLLTWMIERLRATGHSIEILPHHAWVQRLLDYTARHPSMSLAPFMPLFVERWSADQLTLLEIYSEERIPAFDCSNTLEALRGTSIACPPVDDGLLRKYMDYFARIDFFAPAPEAGPALSMLPFSLAPEPSRRIVR